MRLEIRGLQAVQRGMLKAVRAVKPDGALGRAVRFLGIAAHGYLIGITHVDTGAYRSSQLIQWEGRARLRIMVSKGARNPRTRALVSSYAGIEEARGGDHAAYLRTVEHARANYAPRAAAMLAREIL